MVKKMYEGKLIVTPEGKPDAKLRIFCVPYAGGGVSAYSDWVDFFPEGIELSIINLPGRGSRYCEKPYRRLSNLIEELGYELTYYFEKPFVFFGHSMGTLIAFEMTRYLRRVNLPMPGHLFVSGGKAPHCRKEGKDSLNYKMEDKEFIDRMIKMGGIPEELMQEPEILNFLLPTIKADVEIIDTYEFIDEDPLPCPITAFGGTNDIDVTENMIKAWRSHTYGGFRMNMFPGDHFFINDNLNWIINNILNDIGNFCLS